MSDFSLDDILDKYSHKDGGKSSSEDVDDILNDILGISSSPHKSGEKEQTEDPYIGIFGEQKQNRSKSGDPLVFASSEEKRLQTEKRRAEFEEKQQLAEDKKREELAKKQRIAEERKRAEKEKLEKIEAEAKLIAEEEERKRKEEEERRLAEAQARAEEEERKRKEEEELRIAEERARAEAEARRIAEEEERKRKEEEEARRLAEEEAKKSAETQRSDIPAAAEAVQPSAETENAQNGAPASEERLSAEERMRQQEEELKRRKFEEEERRFATKSVIVQDVPIELPGNAGKDSGQDQAEPTTEEIQLEKVLRQQKIEIDSQKLLIKETALEDPDDFLKAINPYDFSKKSEYTQQIETLTAEQMAGDTMGVDAILLKELAKSNAADPLVEDTRSIERIVGGDTRIMPDIEKPETSGYAINLDKTFEINDDIKEFIPKSDTKEVRKHSEEEERLLRSINNTIEQKRLSDIHDTNPASAYDTGPFDKIVIPTNTFKYEADVNKALHTGEIPMHDPEIAEQKLKELATKRKRRLSNFVLEDISDDDLDYYDDSAGEVNEDDEAGIWTDLVETQKSLRLRFVLLFIVTAAVFAIDIIQKVFIYQKIGMFGNELGILSNDGIVFANLIGGVLGMILCSSVMISGLGKIFKGKADCDSVCAVSCTVSLLASVLNLIDTNDLQQGRAFIYIPAALLGLLLNSVGKLSMIKRAKKNYHFMQSDAAKYCAEIVDGQSEASAFTKGVVSELPYLVTMRKTELFTDFLKKSYCEDMADRIAKRLVPISLAAGMIMGLLVYFIPNTTEVNGVQVFNNNIYWATSVFVAFVCLLSPFSMMFLVNNPFRRASRALLKHGSALLGYTSAEEFGEANSVLVDAATLFPKSAIECTNIKPCKLQNSINNISLDMAIILAASLAVNCNSVLSGLFFEMIGANREMLLKIDGCVYEDNMGVMGWYENKRIIMGSREHMKHHSIKIPEMSAIAKYSRNGSDSVYLAVGGELAVIFFIRLTANPSVRSEIKELTSRGTSVIIKTTDSLITIGRITDLFDVDPERVRIIGSSLHGLYNECTSYTANGCGALSGTGSFVSLAKGINASKKLLKDVSMSRVSLILGLIIGALFMIFLAFSPITAVFTPEAIIGWNLLWLLIMLFIQGFRKY
ncbi:MAG: hypothetical protein IJ784_13915 [Ruminiclostridium sp.]|nr:hypothetical protein [Ruminiclostridium sp.]